MAELDLDAIEARADAATEGPWTHRGRNRIDTPTINVDEANWGGENIHGYRLVSWDDDGAWRNADAEFVAHARTDVPALVAEVRRLRGFARDVAEHGLRADLTPTINMRNAGAAYERMIDYLHRIDDTLRDRARSALTGGTDG